MARRPDRTCPVTGLPVPYKGFGRPTVYHDEAKRRRPYEYSLHELETLALANDMRREFNTQPAVIEARIIREKAKVHERSLMKLIQPRAYGRKPAHRQ